MNKPDPSLYLSAIRHDNSLAIDDDAVALWHQDLNNGFRWVLRPVLQLFFAVLLHLVWFLKRLPFPQFSAHRLLQKTICWFCTHFVSPEANLLILRHFWTETNVLNFLLSNSNNAYRVDLYPTKINDMLSATFIEHDQQLFTSFVALGHHRFAGKQALNWQAWRPLDMKKFDLTKRKTQVLDFETSHALFMCLFCLLLKRDEYRDAINGFNLDQSIAIRIGDLIGDPNLAELAYNKYPQYLVGPWDLGQRFLMHGFFTEHLYAKLEQLRLSELDKDQEAK